MNDKTKEKIATRSAYAILALLMVAALTVTVIAIVATVNKKPAKLPPENEGTPPAGDNVQPNPDENGGQNQNPPVEEPPADQPPADQPPADQPPTGNEEPKPEKQIFALPSNGYVMKDYSEDVLVFSSTMNDYRVHLGVDIAGNLGDPVYSFCEGTVKEIINHPFMGKTVVLTHANGIESRYMNLAEQLPENVTVGAVIPLGAVIGAIGETAISECADNPHLHFEVFANGKQVSPSGYVTFNTDTPTVTE